MESIGWSGGLISILLESYCRDFLSLKRSSVVGGATILNDPTINPCKMISNKYSRKYLFQRVVEARVFIEKHFDEQVNLNDITIKHPSIPKFLFNRVFKSQYGKTLRQYLTSLRVEYAKELLKTDLTIAQICVSAGFNSIKSFNRIFKRHTTFSPASHRKFHRD